jgi:outer membrane cobalamin receptor
MKITFLILLAFWWLVPYAGFSQVVNDSTTTDSTSHSRDYYAMSLEELLQLKNSGLSSELEKLINSLIGVASQKPQSTRKTPSIISLITEEEISSSGARDLIDVLRLVPGFDFGTDVQGAVSLGIRGNWAHEGKVLMLLDGQEMNETLYSTLQFGNHFDVSQIKRIEIIRGPGSAIYGGYAEYGVISIITKSANDLNGVHVTGTYGQLKETYGRRNISLSAGKQWGDLGINLAVFAGQGNRSDQTYRGFQGAISRIDTVYKEGAIERIDTIQQNPHFDMAGNARLDPLNINLGVSYKGWSFRGIYDRYQTTTRDGYDATLSQPYPNNFTSYFAELKYSWKLNHKLTLIPRFNFKRQAPWRLPESLDEYSAYDRTADRYRGNLILNYDASRRLNIVLGGEFFNDFAVDRVKNGGFYNGKTTIDFSNKAMFAQLLFKHPVANLTVGARYDHNSAFGGAFVPRIGITRKMNKLHLKFLYANSFRAPGIENIDVAVNNQIKPEKTRVIELEAGYQLSKNTLLTANVFDVSTGNPIIYTYDPTTATEAYRNFERTGSRGVEIEYKWKGHWGFLNLNYAFYSTAGRNQVNLYELPGQQNIRLAFPAHKINLNSSIKITSNISINPSGTLMSHRYGYVATDSLAEFKPAVLFNLFIQNQHFLVKGLQAGIGVYDLLNERFSFIQPYNGGHAPLPGPSREIIVRLCYTLGFDRNK